MKKSLNRFFRQVEAWTGLGSEEAYNLVMSLVVIAALVLIRGLILLVVRRRGDVATHYKWRSIVTYVCTAIGIFAVGRIWLEGFESLATFAGLVGAGLAVAMHDTVANVTGWMFILWRRPFQVGDRIEIAKTSGDVIDIRLFQFSMLEIGNWVHADQSTGRIIHVPNGLVLREKLANYTKGFEFIWNEVPVLVTFESNWRKAKDLLEKVTESEEFLVSEDAAKQIRQTARKYMIVYGKLTPIVYTSVEESGVLLTMRYLTNPRKRRSTEQAMWEAVLASFGEHDDIDFAYPTIRRFDHSAEGKATERPAG